VLCFWEGREQDQQPGTSKSPHRELLSHSIVMGGAGMSAALVHEA